MRPTERLHGKVALDEVFAELAERLRQLGDRPTPAAPVEIEIAGRRLELGYLGAAGLDERLFKISDLSRGADEVVLQEALALTSWEAEVLR